MGADQPVYLGGIAGEQGARCAATSGWMWSRSWSWHRGAPSGLVGEGRRGAGLVEHAELAPWFLRARRGRRLVDQVPVEVGDEGAGVPGVSPRFRHFLMKGLTLATASSR